MILTVRPFFDNPTRYTADLGQEFIDRAREKGFDVIDLYDSDAVASKVLENLGGDITFVCFFDHGDVDRLIGDDGLPAVSFKNLSHFRGKILDVIACSSGIQIGQQATRSGVDFIGYDQIVGFIPFGAYAEGFKRCLLNHMMMMLDGHSIKGALDESKKLWNSYAVRWASDGTEIGKIASAWALSNGKSMKYYGWGSRVFVRPDSEPSPIPQPGPGSEPNTDKKYGIFIGYIRIGKKKVEINREIGF